jgi:hypothetical protein
MTPNMLNYTERKLHFQSWKKNPVLDFAGKLFCTLFPQLAARCLRVRPRETPAGGKLQKQGANGGGGHRFQRFRPASRVFIFSQELNSPD